jgi:hypothetical protein
MSMRITHTYTLLLLLCVVVVVVVVQLGVILICVLGVYSGLSASYYV